MYDINHCDATSRALNKKIIASFLFFPVIGFCFFMLFALFMTVGSNKAHARAPMNITLGKADMIDMGRNVADVLVANPNVIDVMAVKSNRLYVVGLQVGDTNLIALDAQGNIVRRLDIHVNYDLQAIQAMVNNLYPDEKVKIKAVHDQILLTGKVSTPEKAAKITNVVAHYVSDLQDEDGEVDELISNLLEVQGEQQVMLQVKIVEATRSILKQLGVEANANDPNEIATTTIFGGTPSGSNSSGSDSLAFATGAGLALSGDPVGVGRAILDTGINGIGTIGLFLNALEEENLVNVLAEPNLTAISGEQAGFLAGGEFPIPIGRDNVGNIVVEFREFGVSLNFKPIVLSDKRISLNMNTEVSALDFGTAIVLADLTVPGLDIRRAETTVEIPSGASLMIAGLLQSETVKDMSGLPGVKDTPIIGDLVKSESFERDETELVVVVTPYLVEPYKEKDRTTPVPKKKTNPMAMMFAANIRRNYEDIAEDLFAEDQRYGYLLN
ncbi:MAG: type II and III secretion system protein family protein [Pseudomonadota bacterium]